MTLIVATAQGLKMHGGVAVEDIKKPNSEGLRKGLANLDKHIKNRSRSVRPWLWCSTAMQATWLRRSTS